MQIKQEAYLDLIIQIQNRFCLQLNLVLLCLDMVVIHLKLTRHFRYFLLVTVAGFLLVCTKLLLQIVEPLVMVATCVLKLRLHFCLQLLDFVVSSTYFI